ncbi:PmoA family protein [Microbacterium aoyamense]|uniref:PmoA family protein n=1 Tax=Microbacterium aoyamense TaxID=344166 RepID=A0ABP5AXD4_9MICO|nr:PmoA family protein [Microbacterium aoyamense]
MTGLSIVEEAGAVAVRDGEIVLLRYTYLPDTPVYESPKPFIHPLRTRAGRLVSLFRPHDHVWHKGIAWSLPVVGEENFWGGPTYVRDSGYVQLANNGTQRHISGPTVTVSDGVARIAHALEWVTESGATVFREQRILSARLLTDDAWALTFETAMRNVTDAAIAIGSPTTRGRPNAGYGGLFWRGPRSFTGGTLIAPGVRGGDELRGTRHEWMGFVGAHDGDDASSLVLILDHADNPHHPPQWFARSEEFAALNPAPFFSEEFETAPGATATFRYGVAISDGDGADAEALAAALRSAPTS